nr:Chain I, TRYPSIN INHIBITOR A [Momordica charantia]
RICPRIWMECTRDSDCMAKCICVAGHCG